MHVRYGEDGGWMMELYEGGRGGVTKIVTLMMITKTAMVTIMMMVVVVIMVTAMVMAMIMLR